MKPRAFLSAGVDFENVKRLSEQVALTSGPAVLADGLSTVTLSLTATDGLQPSKALAGALFDFSANGNGRWWFTDCNGQNLGSGPSVNADDSGQISVCVASNTVGEMLVTAQDDDSGLSAFAPVTFIAGPANSDNSEIDPSPDGTWGGQPLMLIFGTNPHWPVYLKTLDAWQANSSNNLHN